MRPALPKTVPLAWRVKAASMTHVEISLDSPAAEIDRLKQELAAAQARIDSLVAQLELGAGTITHPGEERPGFLPADALLRRLDEELDRARRYDKQLCVLLLKLDGWESIRARHTPQVTAEILRATGRMISQYMRRSDLAASLEDSRFLILMPETSLAGGQAFGERLCQAVEALQVFNEHRERILLRANVGLAQGNRETLTRDSLMILAEDALGKPR